MNKTEALLKLMEAIALLGFDEELIDMDDARDGDGIVVRFRQFKGTVTIGIREYWKYAGAYCYFVSFSTEGGDFTAFAGTPYIPRVMFNLGEAVESFNSWNMKKAEG